MLEFHIVHLSSAYTWHLLLHVGQNRPLGSTAETLPADFRNPPYGFTAGWLSPKLLICHCWTGWIPNIVVVVQGRFLAALGMRIQALGFSFQEKLQDLELPPVPETTLAAGSRLRM